MLPNKQVPLGPPGPSGKPVPGAPGPGGKQPSQEEVRSMLTQVITEAKKLADQYGIDLNSLIPSGGKGMPPPPVPSQPAM
jgi:hypothetical protein